jgi:hypothetical protein
MLFLAAVPCVPSIKDPQHAPVLDYSDKNSRENSMSVQKKSAFRTKIWRIKESSSCQVVQFW